MKFYSLFALTLLAHAGLAAPLNERSALSWAEKNKLDIHKFFEAQLKKLDIIKTVKAPSGQIIDWIKVDDDACSSPPPKVPQPKAFVAHKTELDQIEKGPPGTVPRYRKRLDHINYNVTTLESLLKKFGPLGHNGTRLSKRQTVDGDYWYANTGQTIDNLGGQGLFSIYNPQTEDPDHSIMQIAVIRQDGANGIPGAGSRHTQTVEVGLTVDKSLNGDQETRLFTYFTTNGYASTADNVGGYYSEVVGWNQCDPDYGPGNTYPISEVGGVTYFQSIQFSLHDGKWWLWINDRWVGNYKADLFSANAPDASLTLQDHSDYIAFYGEVYDANSNPGVTTTDMGSGQFAGEHDNRAATIRNILVEDLNGNNVDYNGAGSYNVPDTASRYNLEEHYVSGGDWGSYIWLGGPGSG
jgi:Neprosin